ncbi:MAG: bifunctional methylenetetrahydrofolate dehydrogenase/methenyltetrahydrofolate cyclohydrolase FolD [Clostridia bacterium]|nr:bifunctional methylenetetrahydrofolate dehydrogenase/methenyltetrahydrofolate cyclohydrolase FolD [Clostridia bacterium]
MAAVLMDGKWLSEQLTEKQVHRVKELREKGKTVTLSVVLVGDDPASQTYVRNKQLACEKLGILGSTVLLPGTISQQELENRLDELCADEKTDGVLLQLPLPKGLDEKRALMHIPPEKDVDGFHTYNQGALFSGADGVVACTPKGVMHMLKSYGVPLSGKHAVVVGRSNIVGKPAALLLLQENCTVTVCHSRTEDLPSFTRQADILVAAVGKAKMITADMVKEGAAVVDVGINRVDGKLCGDVDFESVREKAGWISPVPGGVGKMTVAMLMENVIDAAEKRMTE